MASKKYDAIIIGSGQAGTPLAFSLAKEGVKVAFIEKQHLGGTCLNVGCTPTKTYVASARRMWDIAHSEDVGIEFSGTFKANMQQIKKRKDALIAKSVKGMTEGIENNEHIEFIKGEAKFLSNYEVEVNGESYTADKIFINVGGRPFVPDEYKDLPYLTNASILELTSVPEHLVIIGGSYIGLEFAQMFRRFGSEVTVVERAKEIIGREDKEVGQEVSRFLKEEGIEFVLDAKKIEPREIDNGIELTVNDDKIVTGTHLMIAIGRKPNTDLVDIDKTDIELNKRGYIQVDDYCKTNVEGIYAMGDCNGEGAFTHTAYNDYQIVYDQLYGSKRRKISDRIMTYGLFVDPPLGRCGITKQQALEKGINLKVGSRKMSRIARAKEKAETNGFMEILVDGDTDKIVGACILGTGGDEIITSVLNVMYADKPYTLIRDSIVPHPTISELIPTTLENLSTLNEQ